jgi:hypothetical protein
MCQGRPVQQEVQHARNSIGSNHRHRRGRPAPVMAAASSAGYGGGGNTFQFAGMVAKYNLSGEEFRITEHCQSACTMFLGIRNACVERNAQLLFHAAQNPAGTARMAASYNAALRSYLESHGWLSTPQFHAMSGAQVIAFGYRACR